MTTRTARRRGFTLIEVVVTLTIFILLTGSVFGIMTAVFQSSNDLQANQNRRDQVTALREYLQTTFTRLGSDDHFIPYSGHQNDALVIDGVILGSGTGLEAIDITSQPNGLFQLRLGRPADQHFFTVQIDHQTTDVSAQVFRQQLEKNQSAVDWKPLIRDVRTLTWKFQDRAASDWLETWERDPAKPALVECTVQLAGDDAPTVIDFQIPHLSQPPGAISGYSFSGKTGTAQKQQ